MNPQLYIWLKVFHLVMVMAWMVSIFYLPRILVHIVEGRAANQSVDRLFIMARKLFMFGNIMMVIAWITGLWIAISMGYFSGQGWLHAKLLLVVILIGYNHMTLGLVKKAEKGSLSWSSKALRWFNELPIILVVIAVFLVIGKPM
ncbi:CopD family protein [Opitutia bacterium ISCC 51]|nr:CopD family protein [Opitutae bacterium ISCC 51]QXD28779.1 CopD family protein [Opitutae bacterium ISCC 52]